MFGNFTTLRLKGLKSKQLNRNHDFHVTWIQITDDTQNENST